MGSATREALSNSRSALAGLGGKAQLATGEQLLAAGRVLGTSFQLRAALADPSGDRDAKLSIVNAVFASIDASARELLGVIATNVWSSEDDLLAGVEEIGIRVLAQSAPSSDIEAELFAFGAVVQSDSQLELAVGSKLGSDESKAALIERLLGAKASKQSVAIVSHLVQQPRGRRIGELLRFATSVVADEAGLAVATVTTASAISAEQLTRLTAALSANYGRGLRINHVIDPSLVGGVRVQLGDEVIDGSVASRLNELRLQLA
ncbi:F-type H+-transporting ATPase subunit delta [Conyzicola lurida]|uniref:ATP synthase subunit delta n=1 Tax=Conyzicola lurida TaxID=1172621 RepID=A0A841AJS2_9MICO|nr:F-type H+-transporting ATPase subunit delta [Conyzicola lurida]